MKMMHHRAGFSLLELLVVITIISVITALVLPQFMQMQPGYIRKQFVNNVNNLVQTGLQQAVVTQKVHRIMVDVKKRTMQIEKETEKKDGAGKATFEPLKGLDLATQFNWPDTIEIKQFFIEGFDEMKRFTGTQTKTLWFYIVPDGMAQAVIINFVDKEQLVDGKPKQMGLTLNPFTGQFKVHYAFAQ